MPRLVKFPRSAAPQKLCFSSPRLDHYAHTIIGHDVDDVDDVDGVDGVDDVDDVYASSEMCEDDVKSAEKPLTGELQGSSRAL